MASAALLKITLQPKKNLAELGKSINFAEIFVTSVGKIVWPLYVAKTIVYYKHLFYNGFN